MSNKLAALIPIARFVVVVTAMGWCAQSISFAQSVTLPAKVETATQATSDTLTPATAKTSESDTRTLSERTGVKSSVPFSELPTSGESVSAIMRMIGALCAVLALMWVVVLIAKRYMKGRPSLSGAGKLMSVTETLWLGPKKQIVLLTVGSRHIVVGITDEQMTTLSELSREDLSNDSLANTAAKKADPSSPFDRLLAQAGGRLQHLLKRTSATT